MCGSHATSLTKTYVLLSYPHRHHPGAYTHACHTAGGHHAHLRGPHRRQPPQRPALHRPAHHGGQAPLGELERLQERRRAAEVEPAPSSARLAPLRLTPGDRETLQNTDALKGEDTWDDVIAEMAAEFEALGIVPPRADASPWDSVLSNEPNDWPRAGPLWPLGAPSWSPARPPETPRSPDKRLAGGPWGGRGRLLLHSHPDRPAAQLFLALGVPIPAVVGEHQLLAQRLAA
jgi:hypothetical protein